MLEAQVRTSGPKGSLWKHPDFLKLWLAQTISATGDQFTYLAVPLIATLSLDASASQMGILAALGTAPFLLISLFAGIWVDRLRRRPMLIIADLGRAIILLSIPVAAMAHSLRMGQLFVVEFLVGILSVFFEIAYQAYLPALVDKQLLIEGNSKLAATQSLAGLAGPGLAGVVIQFFSAPSAIVLDAVSYCFSGGLVGVIGQREVPQNQTERARMMVEVREGLAFVLSDPYLRSIAGCTGTFNFFFAAISALYIIFATRTLVLGPASIGFIFGVGNVAGLLGAISAGWLSRKFGFGRVVITAIFLTGVGMVPIAFATPKTAFGLLIASRLIFSFTVPVYNINQISLRQSITPHRLQGRMTATMRFLVWGTLPLGGLAGGLLGQALGLRVAIAIAAVGEVSAFLWILFSPVRSLQFIPEPPD